MTCSSSRLIVINLSFGRILKVVKVVKYWGKMATSILIVYFARLTLNMLSLVVKIRIWILTFYI